MIARAARPLIAVALSAAPLAACHHAAEDPSAAGADEQRQLNESAATLDAQGHAAAGADNAR